MDTKKLKLILGIGGTVVALGLILATSVIGLIIGVNNECIRYENGIKQKYADNQNVYDNYTKKVIEAAQVTTKYAKDVEKVVTAAISGRYGKEGSKAMWQWLQENNPSLDSSVYKQIQQIIEAGRNDFTSNQTTLLDKKREYDTYRQVFPNVIVAKAFGYPKIDLAKYDIVTSDDTQKVFETKKSEPVAVFN